MPPVGEVWALNRIHSLESVFSGVVSQNPLFRSLLEATTFSPFGDDGDLDIPSQPQ